MALHLTEAERAIIAFSWGELKLSVSIDTLTDAGSVKAAKMRGAMMHLVDTRRQLMALGTYTPERAATIRKAWKAAKAQLCEEWQALEEFFHHVQRGGTL